ncbi:hypothetical protein D3C81_702520 [compost metagenome]
MIQHIPGIGRADGRCENDGNPDNPHSSPAFLLGKNGEHNVHEQRHNNPRTRGLDEASNEQ